MEDLYRLEDDPTASSSYSDDLFRDGDFSTAGDYTASTCVDSMLQFNHEITTTTTTTTTTGSDIPDDLIIKAQIKNHPAYSNLVSAYIDCQKVGAPPEMASLLEEINQENNTTRSCIGENGADPELDEFMESYCEVLHRYKEELSKPFDEATTFLNNIESQLSNLCKGDSIRTLDYPSEEAAGTSEEEEPADVKEMLMRKYSGSINGLEKGFLKKRNKVKLPKDAKTTLMDWWTEHYKWPYPTEDDRLKLSEQTGLDQKQINNWFINQRRRHWKPSEDIYIYM